LYEVVPAGTEATLHLLYAPAMPTSAECRKEALENLGKAIENLLTLYGFSAKRTAGWGLAAIDKDKLKKTITDWLGKQA
jgi:CRISPR-associated protein Cmr2